MPGIRWGFELKRTLGIIAVLVTGGCASFATMNLIELYGESAPRNRVVEAVGPNQVDYWSEVKPIVDSRCVVCHACYDASCQLKLSSIEGIERGASKEVVYNQARLFSAEPNRLFDDAQTVEEWRQRGFHSVLNEHDQSIIANREAGLIYQMLKLKDSHPFPENQKLGEEYEFGLDRELTCPAPNEFQKFAEEHPAWGMPYAFPALSSVESGTLKRWLEQGATYTARPPLEKPYLDRVAKWESFFNGDSNKQRLMSRYIYEHLFLGHLFFDQLNNDEENTRHYFEMVRSSTPPGQPIEIIATRRPYDDPGVERVYYRLRELKSTIVAKTHMPYALNPRRMNFWRELFIDKPYEVPTMPGYHKEMASNPFVVFQHLPVSSRYKFMLDEAQYTVMGFIKGPVCRGQVALNVIRDNFWVVFVAPNELHDGKIAEFYSKNSDILALPEGEDSSSKPLRTWRKYSQRYSELVQKKDEFLEANLASKVAYNLDLVWDGDGVNQNAALTVFRHFDSATVEKGFLGNPPETAWLVGYSELERIHYLLVAGYDVYGNFGHQLLSRLYMDFLRMSSEGAFLLLMPNEQRDAERNNWYRGADPELLALLSSPAFESEHEPDINYHTDNVKAELFEKIEQRLGKAMKRDRQVTDINSRAIDKPLSAINQLRGAQLEYLPEHAFLIIEAGSDSEVFTIIRNNAHSNVTSMFKEQKNRLPAEDTMSVLKRFVGSYPGALFKVSKTEVQQFVKMFARVESEDSFQLLIDKFGVRRTRADFWSVSDELNSLYRHTEPLNAGILDYNRYGNY